MKSKLALMLIAMVGSTALVATAQTPYPPTRYGLTPGTQPPNPPQDVLFPIEAPPPPETPVFTPAIPLPPPPPGQNSANFPGASVFRNSDWNLRAGSPEEATLAREADTLVRQLGEARSDADREKHRARLGEVLEKQFDQRQRRHEAEINALEVQVKKLRDLVQKRQENRREIVGRRLEQILRESQGLGW